MDSYKISKLGLILRDLSQCIDALRSERSSVEHSQRVIGRLESQEKTHKENLKCALADLGIPYDERLDPEFFCELYRQLSQPPQYVRGGQV